ncbi:single-stranded-DNA-specific exonuclease RecJ [Phocicoccus pinnipedialis]|uniref:single-stranded-DNA-specific exonuclease RecJ n=1 Tax=Phocicoccus pinnipedialis TaxID=110845 RepID=UPI001ABBB64C|nr:single-stranded-DNA-specific exonuclease RecJ [Jeotgalicoccus pinnipedialis]
MHKKTEQIDEETVKNYSISPLAKEFLEGRQITSNDKLEAVLHPQFGNYNDIYDIDRATNLINKHIDEGSTILIYGDYDADGITSTVLLYSALLEKTDNVHFFIPNRVEHGYGPNFDFFDHEVVGNVELIITVDNGVTAVKEFELLKENGVDAIIIDHHEFSDTLPDAIVIHPNHPNGNYSDPYLAGVGITYKVVEALGLLQPNHIGLAAIGTVADMVPMFGENKKIVIDGLKELNQNIPLGLKALMNLNDNTDPIDTETIGFFFGPRLNSTGRISDASIGVELLLTDDISYANMLAAEIEELNNTRKDMVETTVLEVKEDINRENKVQIIYGKDWHPGILGIVASRIVEECGVPAILLTHDEGVYKGSSRSIDGVDLLSLMRSVDATFTAHGHAAAFGITVPEEDIETFQRAAINYFNENIKKTKPTRYVDLELSDSFSEDDLNEIYKLGPFGQGFSAPVFLKEQKPIEEIRQIGRDKTHLKFKLKDSPLDYIGFNFGHFADEVFNDDYISVIGKINVNVFNGNRKLQMIVEDIKMDELRVLDMRAKADQKFNLIKETDIFLIQEGKEKLGSNYFHYGERIPFIASSLVLRDLPIDLEAFEFTLRELKVGKIIAILNQKEELFFNGIPKEVTVREAYKLITEVKNGAIDLKVHAPRFAKRLNVSMKNLEKIMNILIDLNRVKLVNGVVFYNPEITETILVSESNLYTDMQKKLASESKLKMSSRPELKKYLEDLITSSNI